VEFATTTRVHGPRTMRPPRVLIGFGRGIWFCREAVRNFFEERDSTYIISYIYVSSPLLLDIPRGLRRNTSRRSSTTSLHGPVSYPQSDQVPMLVISSVFQIRRSTSPYERGAFWQTNSVKKVNMVMARTCPVRRCSTPKRLQQSRKCSFH
jgi:hypothetical protein